MVGPVPDSPGSCLRAVLTQARAHVRTRESSIATPRAGNTTETNTAGYR